MKNIGYTNASYPEKRTIIEGNLHPLKKVKSLNMYYPQKAVKMIPIIGKNREVSFEEIIFSTKGVDGLHLFNSVTNRNIPWVSTFETYIPRSTATSFLKNDINKSKAKKDKNKIKKLMKLIANENCKKIISLSNQNLKMELRLLEEFPEYKNIIEEKLIHINPPQEKLIERREVETKRTNSVLKFLFVGKDFTRKGGREIIDVFTKIKEETDFQFELTIVSLGKNFNYAFGKYQDSEEEIEEVKNKINSSNWIKFYEQVENKKLLEMMKKSDVGLLPTWADTYGYSVLEFQASGCPVITTNIRALPEINNSSVGWVIDLPTDDFGEVIIESNTMKEKLRKNLQKSLKSIVIDIIKNPNQIKEKSLKSFDQVSINHSVENYMEKLSSIYTNSF